MVKEMVVKRFKDILKSRLMSANELAIISGVNRSTVYSMLKNERKDIKISTIKKLCDGLEITLGEFFSTYEFDNLEQEIKWLKNFLGKLKFIATIIL